MLGFVKWCTRFLAKKFLMLLRDSRFPIVHRIARCVKVYERCAYVSMYQITAYLFRAARTQWITTEWSLFFGRCTSRPSFLSFSTVFQNYMSTWYVYTHIANNERQQCNNKIQSSSQKSVSHFQIQFGICRFNDFRFNVILYDKDLFPFFSYLWRIRFE